nr:unnamed protein product [Callosobruchus analis]
MPSGSQVVTRKKKRILTPWTDEQNEVVKYYFNKHIERKKSPKNWSAKNSKSCIQNCWPLRLAKN